MTTIITDFHELSLPASDNPHCGLDDRKDWYTCDKNHMGVYYLLNDGSYTLSNLLDGLQYKDFYFDTITECHAHAAVYYIKHNKIYPYFSEWAVAHDCIAVSNNSKDAIGSQVMEFI